MLDSMFRIPFLNEGFDVFLTKRLSIILVTNQLSAQILVL